MKKDRIIIAGSRTVPENDIPLLLKIESLLINMKGDDGEIVSGGAKGADKLGEKFAKDMSVPIKQFLADWDKHGKKAGYLRNKQMAEYGTHLIAIVDLCVESRGTRSMIKLAQEYGLKIRILYINENKAKYSKIVLDN